MRVLEPSAGSGAFVTPLLKHQGVSVEALEMDPEWAVGLERQHAGNPNLMVHNADFLSWKPTRMTKFDLAVMNPPYENDQDTDHLVHALGMSDRVVALTRTNIVHSVGRYERIWRHVVLTRKINFIDRPKFSGAGSPRHDFCVVEMHMPVARPALISVQTEWWYAS